MKKIVFACAILLASVLSSCGDTNYCYEVKETIKIAGLETTITEYLWCTSNELDAAIAELEAEIVEEYGLSKDALKVTYKQTHKSQADCELLDEAE